jgi:hypothetical protein
VGDHTGATEGHRVGTGQIVGQCNDVLDRGDGLLGIPNRTGR